jgi:hypothetical protein
LFSHFKEVAQSENGARKVAGAEFIKCAIKPSYTHIEVNAQLLARDKDLQGAPVQVRTSRYIPFVAHIIPSQ